MAKKYVETYSSSNAAAQDPEERVRLINIQQIHYKINSLIQKLQKKKKIERTRRLTNLEWPKSYIFLAHPITTREPLNRTVRIINNFRLIYSNVRNYSLRTSNANAKHAGVGPGVGDAVCGGSKPEKYPHPLPTQIFRLALAPSSLVILSARFNHWMTLRENRKLLTD